MFPPERIVCLTEETVETLYLLGEERRIVGLLVRQEIPTGGGRPAPQFRLHSRREARRAARDQIVADSPAGAGGAYRRARGALQAIIVNAMALKTAMQG
jgi:hypothetical protein